MANECRRMENIWIILKPLIFFSNITQIWGVFFLPIVSMVLVLTFTFFLLGKQYIRRIYQKYKIIKIDNEYYRQKHVKTKKD